MIAGLLLAAGRSSRFGGDKLCALLHGAPVITWSVNALAGLDHIVVVTGPDDAAIRDALGARVVHFVRNEARDSGMASSIRAGVDALPAGVEAVVIALGDQPFASAAVTHALIAHWHRGAADIVIPEYSDGRGHPVLFGRSCFAELRAIGGDTGARGLVESNRFRVSRVHVPLPAPLDVDTPEALALAVARATDEASMSPPSV